MLRAAVIDGGVLAEHLDYIDEEGCSALYLSAKDGHLLMVELLLGRGANVQQANRKSLPKMATLPW